MRPGAGAAGVRARAAPPARPPARPRTGVRRHAQRARKDGHVAKHGPLRAAAERGLLGAAGRLGVLRARVWRERAGARPRRAGAATHVTTCRLRRVSIATLSAIHGRSARGARQWDSDGGLIRASRAPSSVLTSRTTKRAGLASLALQSRGSYSRGVDDCGVDCLRERGAEARSPRTTPVRAPFIILGVVLRLSGAAAATAVCAPAPAPPASPPRSLTRAAWHEPRRPACPPRWSTSPRRR